MELKGEQAIVTPSEAGWLQEMSMGHAPMPAFGQRLLDVRRRLALDHGTSPVSEEVQLTVVEAMANVMGRVTLTRELEALSESEKAYGCNPDGSERHSITVMMTTAEQAEILRQAKIHHELAADEIMTFSVGADGYHQVIDDIALRAALSDTTDMTSALELLDLQRNPQFRAFRDNYSLNDARRRHRATAGVIAALDKNRSI